MKIILLTVFLTGIAYAYDGVIKDKYGNILFILENAGKPSSPEAHECINNT